jgi:hypothetical protein
MNEEGFVVKEVDSGQMLVIFHFLARPNGWSAVESSTGVADPRG